MSGSSDEGRRLRCGAEQLGIDLSEQAAAKLIAFLECLYLWNKSAGLTTIERSEAVRLHLLDSLTALPLLGRCVAIADLGSGPGLPGIPLAIALPASRLVLVESRRRKCSFLAETIRELGLENCRVEQADARRYGGSPRLDAVVARAFLAPLGLVTVAAPLLAPGGRLLIMGSRVPIDTAALETAAGATMSCTEIVELTLPGGSEQRRLVLLERRGQ